LVTDKVIKAEDKLERFVLEGKLSPEGRAAFIAATDPFHDTGITDLCGWPDLETRPSVVRCVKKSTNVSARGMTAIHCYTYPVINASVCRACNRRNGVVDSVNPGFAYCSPFVINSYAGVDVDNMTPGNYAASLSLALDPSYLQNPTRVLGFGFEIRDVTADLYKQGTITTYCVPQSQDQDNQFTFREQNIDGTKYILTPTQGRLFQPFPHNVESALLYEGSRQWEAREGCYSVIPFSAKDNVARAPEYTTPFLRNNDDANDYVDSLNTGTLYFGPYAAGSVDGDNIIFQPGMYTPMHSKGAILTGINDNCNYQINVVWFLETFPNRVTDPLMTLARPSATYDPVALEMIAVTMKSMPVSVPVAENGLGDFFLEIVDKIAPVVGGLASAFFPEFAPIIMPMAGGAAALARKAKANKASKRAKKGKEAKTSVDFRVTSPKVKINPQSQGGTRARKRQAKRDATEEAKVAIVKKKTA